MEFGERIPRKAGPGADGHYEWERPGQHARWEAQKREAALANAPKTAGMNLEDTVRVYGVRPEDLVTAGRDKIVLQEQPPVGETGCEPQATDRWMPPQQPGYGPWIETVHGQSLPKKAGQILLGYERSEKNFHPIADGVLSYYGEIRRDEKNDDIVAYCLALPSPIREEDA